MHRRPLLFLLALGIATAVLSATPSKASAQIGWVKKVLGKDKKKKQPPPAAAQQPGAAAPAGAAPQPGQPAAPGVVAPQPQAAGSVPPVAQQDPAAAALAAQQRAERDSMIAEGRRLDGEVPQTTDKAKYRLNYWEGLKLSGVTSLEVMQRYGKARQDFDQFTREDSVKRANEASAKAANAKMEQATRALNTRDLDGAESAVTEILAGDPTNQRALLLRDRIHKAQKARQFIKTLIILAVAAIALAALIAVLAKKVFNKKDEGGSSSSSTPAAGGGRKIIVKVVDGIGRGKLIPIQADIFRIGAVASDKPEEHNDLIISDAEGVVSRYHCSIIKRGKDYFIVDSSLNGTSLNDKPLERGEHRKLRDGDDVTIADVARLKFLTT